MYNVYDFISWALTKVDPTTILKSAEFPIPKDQCGTDPWHYLFGTVRVHTNAYWLNDRYENYYKGHGYTREQFDEITADWKPTDWATDCQGLLDAWLTYEQEDKTDINANMNYTNWCTDKGAIKDIDRPYVIGEALFMQNAAGTKMTHVGWVCGFLTDGTPLAVEARGIKYGVVVTKVPTRGWTHRGIMTEKFEYNKPEVKPYIFSLQRPYLTGKECSLMQDTLNRLGYRTGGGDMLEVDGKWGPLSQSVLETFVELNSPEQPPQPEIVEAVGIPDTNLTILVVKDTE